MANLSILIVEDESIVARDIQGMLYRLGYRVSAIASRGKEAIEKARETHPDLVLMDIKLKDDMDGIETARKIQSCLYIPVIYMSALSDQESLKRARETGPFFFISKPVEQHELRTNIEEAYSTYNKQCKSSKRK